MSLRIVLTALVFFVVLVAGAAAGPRTVTECLTD